jgi:hypothetical protein
MSLRSLLFPTFKPACLSTHPKKGEYMDSRDVLWRDGVYPEASPPLECSVDSLLCRCLITLGRSQEAKDALFAEIHLLLLCESLSVGDGVASLRNRRRRDGHGEGRGSEVGDEVGEGGLMSSRE